MTSTIIICTIHKNCEKLVSENYKGITLLCSAYKIFKYILNKPSRQNILGVYQAGLRQGRSTTDQLFTVKLILSKAWRHEIDIIIIIELKQTNDSISREKLYEILHSINVNPKYIGLIETTMNSSSTTCIQNLKTVEFKISLREWTGHKSL